MSKSEEVIYVSYRYPEFIIVVVPELREVVAGGHVKQIQKPVHVKFIKGVYRTSDKKIQEFIEGRETFKQGHIKRADQDEIDAMSPKGLELVRGTVGTQPDPEPDPEAEPDGDEEPKAAVGPKSKKGKKRKKKGKKE